MDEKNTIEIRDWRVIDIYYNDIDEDNVKKVIKSYEQKGYEYQQISEGSGKYENCAQLMTRTKIIKRKING